MLSDSVTSEIDTEFYKVMGYTLTIGFSSWILLSIVVYCIVKTKPINDRFRIMMLFLYYPGRISVLIWGPWLGYKAGISQK